MKRISSLLTKKNRVSLLLVDMQNDFISSKGAFAKMGFQVKNLMKVVSVIKNFKMALKNLDIKTIYVVSNYDDRYLVDSIKKRYRRVGYNIPFCISETWGARIVSELKPENDDIIIVKHRYNAFIGTNLQHILNTLQINTLIFTGIETHVCIQNTAIYAYMLGYDVILIEDCISSLDENDKMYALGYCKRYYGIVKSTKEILKYEQLNF